MYYWIRLHRFDDERYVYLSISNQLNDEIRESFCERYVWKMTHCYSAQSEISNAEESF